ncbi:MAG: hypothetical protein M3Y64_06540 [Gemmatimonadota bacterium]|nr:hypothetical protein [Gemmatimonadota bacterium]
MRAGRVLPAFAFIAAACGSPDDVSDLHLGASLSKPVGATITARIEQPGSVQVISNDELRAPSSGTTAHLSVGIRGNMTITFLVTTTASDTIGLIEINLGLHRKYIHSVTVTRQPAGSPWRCLGCGSLLKFPFRGSEKATTDSLFVYVTSGVPCKECVY